MFRFNYIGSKKTLASWIYSKLLLFINGDEIFIDMFAGTGSMSYYMASYGHTVHANDIQYYSYIILKAILSNYYKKDIKTIKYFINELNNLPLLNESFIQTNYAPPKRMFFTKKNARIIGTMRKHVELLYNNKKINNKVYFYLLACILSSADNIANVATLYSAYLKKFKNSAKKNLILKCDNIQSNNTFKKHKISNKKASELKLHSNSILYLDPPYNQRNYSDNYDVLETIAKNDEPILKGKTGIRLDNFKSQFCSKVYVKDALNDILIKAKSSQVKIIAMSYNSEGIMSIKDINNIFKNVFGYKPKIFKKKYKRFNSHSNIEYNYVYEYLFIHVLFYYTVKTPIISTI